MHANKFSCDAPTYLTLVINPNGGFDLSLQGVRSWKDLA